MQLDSAVCMSVYKQYCWCTDAVFYDFVCRRLAMGSLIEADAESLVRSHSPDGAGHHPLRRMFSASVLGSLLRRDVGTSGLAALALWRCNLMLLRFFSMQIKSDSKMYKMHASGPSRINDAILLKYGVHHDGAT